MRKLTRRSQMFLYAISGFGINFLNLMMGSYLCSALLIGGFGEDAIPFQTFRQHDLVIAGVWAMFVLAAKIIDGVIDIPLASLTDNLRSRWGRRRPSLLIGLVPMLLAYVLFLVVPNPNAATWLNTIYFGVILCLFYSSYTLVMVTYYATFTEIVETERERSFISNVKSVCDIFYFILGYVIIRMMLNNNNIKDVALWTLPLALTMLIPLFMIREDSSLKLEQTAKSVNLIKSLRVTFRNKTFILWMVLYFFMTFGVQLFLGGINEYFSFVGMNMVMVMGGTFSPVPFMLIFYNYLCRRKGFKFAFCYALSMFAAGMILLFFVGFMDQGIAKTIMSIVSGLCCSCAVGALFSVNYSVPSQLAAEEQEKTGISNAAMYFAVQGLFSGVATGLATGVVLTALKGSESNTSGAIVYMTLIAGLATLVAACLITILPKSMMNTQAKSNTQKD